MSLVLVESPQSRKLMIPCGVKLGDCTVKACLKRPLEKNTQKLVFKTDHRLMQVNSIAECCNENILQYFRPSLSYILSFRS